MTAILVCADAEKRGLTEGVLRALGYEVFPVSNSLCSTQSLFGRGTRRFRADVAVAYVSEQEQPLWKTWLQQHVIGRGAALCWFK